MRNLLFALGLSGLLLSGCASWMATPPADPDREKSIPRKAMDRGQDVETDSNINQINQALMMIKQDGGAPASLEDAKRAVKFPDEMWIDKVSGQPLVYDAASGTVHRVGAAPGAPPAAGSPNAPGGINIPQGGGL